MKVWNLLAGSRERTLLENAEMPKKFVLPKRNNSMKPQDVTKVDHSSTGETSLRFGSHAAKPC